MCSIRVYISLNEPVNKHWFGLPETVAEEDCISSQPVFCQGGVETKWWAGYARVPCTMPTFYAKVLST